MEKNKFQTERINKFHDLLNNAIKSQEETYIYLEDKSSKHLTALGLFLGFISFGLKDIIDFIKSDSMNSVMSCFLKYYLFLVIISSFVNIFFHLRVLKFNFFKMLNLSKSSLETTKRNINYDTFLYKITDKLCDIYETNQLVNDDKLKKATLAYNYTIFNLIFVFVFFIFIVINKF